MKTLLSLTLNGRPRIDAVPDNMLLADYLREIVGPTGTKIGCDGGECGCCTVLVDDRPRHACLTLAAAVQVRRIALADLYRDDGMDHLTLSPGEMVTTIHLPAASAGIASAYEKARVRGAIDFPLAGVAVRLRWDGGKAADLRIATTGVHTHPALITGLEKFTGNALDDAALAEIGEMVRSHSRPMRTTTAKPWHRRRVVGAPAHRQGGNSSLLHSVLCGNAVLLRLINRA